MNDNYKLVAELSAENLKLSSEKLRMEQLVDEVRHDQALLKGELNKAQSVVEAMNSASPRLPGRRFQPHLNRPRHLNLNGEHQPDRLGSRPFIFQQTCFMLRNNSIFVSFEN